MWNALAADLRQFAQNMRQETEDLVDVVSRNFNNALDDNDDDDDNNNNDGASPSPSPGRERHRLTSEQRRERDDQAALAAPVFGGDEGMSAVNVALQKVRCRVVRLGERVERRLKAAERRCRQLQMHHGRERGTKEQQQRAEASDMAGQQGEEAGPVPAPRHTDPTLPHGGGGPPEEEEEEEEYVLQRIFGGEVLPRDEAAELQLRDEGEVRQLQRDPNTFLLPLRDDEWEIIQRELFCPASDPPPPPSHPTSEAPCDPVVAATLAKTKAAIPFRDSNNLLYCYGALHFPWGEDLAEEERRAARPPSPSASASTGVANDTPLALSHLPAPPALRLLVENSARLLRERLLNSSHLLHRQLLRFAAAPHRSSARAPSEAMDPAAAAAAIPAVSEKGSGAPAGDTPRRRSSASTTSALPANDFFARYFFRLFLLRRRQLLALQERMAEILNDARSRVERERGAALAAGFPYPTFEELLSGGVHGGARSDAGWLLDTDMSDSSEDVAEEEAVERAMAEAATETISGIYRGFQKVVSALPRLFQRDDDKEEEAAAERMEVRRRSSGEHRSGPTKCAERISLEGSDDDGGGGSAAAAAAAAPAGANQPSFAPASPPHHKTPSAVPSRSLPPADSPDSLRMTTFFPPPPPHAAAAERHGLPALELSGSATSLRSSEQHSTPGSHRVRRRSYGSLNELGSSGTGGSATTLPRQMYRPPTPPLSHAQPAAAVETVSHDAPLPPHEAGPHLSDEEMDSPLPSEDDVFAEVGQPIV